jgi:ElaB/YqjD/DUF883 family membrane-anchored ribosome-binding protein
MNTMTTQQQAQDFIALLAEAGLDDARIDYYVDKLAEGTFDVQELESELTERAQELGSLIDEGETLATDMEAEADEQEAELQPKMGELMEDYKAEMAATAIGVKAEADEIEKRMTRGAESKARKKESGTIAKIKKMLQRKNT